MKRILDPIRVEYVDGRRWRLLEAFSYRLGSADGPESVVVPAGFLTDFASIPRGLWWLFQPTGRWAGAALVHDWLYHSPIVQTGRDEPKHRPIDRDEADRVFLEAMQVMGVSWLTRHTMYRAVRLFGGHAFLA